MALAELQKQRLAQTSTGWKDISLKIYGTEESVVIPVMISAKVLDLKRLVAELHGDVSVHSIDFLYKLGPSWKKMRNNDEIQSRIVVKGIKSFKKGNYEWEHPYLLIGAGHFGLRMGMHMTRQKADYVIVERNHDVGGNAWLTIANTTSKLQTEGPQYQLQYDVFDKNVWGLMEAEQYGFWPSRGEILDHMRDTMQKWGAWPNIRLNTEATEMLIQQDPYRPKWDLNARCYDFELKPTRPTDGPERDVFRCSCLGFFPGCLVVPHRHTWPGEEIFEGQIGYGFSREFDYKKVLNENIVIIGMGAFAHENVRTLVEHGANKMWNVARHFNLMMPRVICWWVNQSSSCPPTAAMVLHAMKSAYDLIGLDPWNFFSVTSNPERTIASIKQYTRWGISDIYFLALYYKKAFIIEAQVKRFKATAAVLTNGQVLDDVRHIVKVIGFDGDFGVDRLMQCTHNVGTFPSGDYRRFVMSDGSAIDASRFTNIAISPAVSSISFMLFHYFTHPQDAIRLLETGMLPITKSEPELGSPCYHFEPRVSVAVGMLMGGFCQELQEFEVGNGRLKKDSMWFLADAAAYNLACRNDWYYYCRLFRDQGWDLPYPRYPYTEQDMLRFCEDEEDLRKREEAAYTSKFEAKVAGDGDHAPGDDAGVGEVADVDQGAAGQGGALLEMTGLDPGAPLTFEPAKRVLQARMRSRSPVGDKDERQRWLSEGHGVLEWLIQHTKKSVKPALRGQR